MFALLTISYSIDLLTTLSISAIATNGTVKGGGAYYMISRSLGPEFGGSIGLVFYIGQVLNAGMNVVGFCEPLLINFGATNGVTAHILPEGRWWTFFYSTLLLLICTGVCMVGSSVFAKAGKILFVILLVSTFTVPISCFFVQPFEDPRFGGAAYTGFSWDTVKDNLLPRFTKGAAGSQISGRETFQDMFGIFFPATAGIFAGASMSGDLKTPSVSIPQGTLRGLLLTFVSYSLVILAMGCCISRDLLYRDVQVLQNVNMSKYLIIMGEFSTSLFSAIVGIIGSAKQLQALARDDVLPLTSVFKQGTPVTDDPIAAVVFTYILAQITLFFDINRIATFITMAFLMTFIVTNLACFLLRIASAPNFRPSFKFFNTYTAACGAAASVAAMFVADGVSASLMIIVLISLFMTIHYISPPKPWGDVSQSLIYHQVRKYLLRLRQDHVKFWRPQILLLVDDPRSAWNLISFCNSLKKGGLYILGHVVVTKDFQQSYDELKKQRNAWLALRDLSRVKAFVQIGAGPDVVWGARNVYLGSGLGGMKPNITVLGFFERRNHFNDEMTSNGIINSNVEVLNNNSLVPMAMGRRQSTKKQSSAPYTTLPTDDCRHESTIDPRQWVNIIEDLLIMRSNVAIAKGFTNLEIPFTKKNPMFSFFSSKHDSSEPSSYQRKPLVKKYIDLFPIQMSAQIIDENGEASALTTNFDTYTLILQMGAILHTVPAWKKNYQLRVIVFVEFEEDVEEERSRINVLLERLRIKAKVIVKCLSDGTIDAYEVIVRGKKDTSGKIEQVLKGNEWWEELQDARREYESKYGGNNNNVFTRLGAFRSKRAGSIINNENIFTNNGEESNNSGSPMPVVPTVKRFSTDITPSAGENDEIYTRLLKNQRKRRHTVSHLQQMGLSFSMQTNKLLKSQMKYATDFFRDELDDDLLCSSSSSSSESDSAVLTDSESLNDAFITKQKRRAMTQDFVIPQKNDDDDNKNNNKVVPSVSGTEHNSSTVNDRFPKGMKKTNSATDFANYDLKQSPTFSKTQIPHSNESTSPGALSVSLGKQPSPNTTSSLISAAISKAGSSGDNNNINLVVPQSGGGSYTSESRSGTSTPGGSTSTIGKKSTTKSRPNFTGVAIPHTTVEELDDGRPTIMFNNADDKNKKKKSAVSASRNVSFDISKGSSAGSSGATTPLKKQVQQQESTDRGHDLNLVEANIGIKHSDDIIISEEQNEDNNSKSFSSSSFSNSDDDDDDDDEEEEEDCAYLSFNDLPANAQHVILNNLMQSSSQDTAVIFSTLPAPQIGTHLSKEESLAYVESLEIWTQDLPPIILLHSQTMTVTTAL